MDGFTQSIGNGITGLVAGSFSTIGFVLRGIVDSLNHALPGGMLAVVAFVVLAVTAWRLRRGPAIRDWALVLVTALLVSPLGQSYYLWLVAGSLWGAWRTLDRWPSWMRSSGIRITSRCICR